MKRIYCLLTCCFLCFLLQPARAQEYFFKDRGPFDPNIPSPEQFLGYPIGSHHTRYDRIVAYFQELARLSDKASFSQYATTYEHRPLIMLTVSAPENHAQLDAHKARHLQLTNPKARNVDVANLPVFINLGYNVHGNEPSSSEAAMLTAYTLVASQSAAVKRYLNEAVVFIDPTINPDGRDRHTQWANMYKGDPLVSDPMDAEHNEGWPRGRTNHYWFDLNRDWLLGIHPESRGKLNWYHEWYPNVVTDFHEMGTNSTYFFEPMKANASKDPIMPQENYTTLNEAFAKYYTRDLDAIGSFYFTKEVFDGTYPGYGSSYPDLQGGLGILFEQASSRGHEQETPMGNITFAFTIRNQYTSSLATVEAAVDNKDLLHRYQRDFFASAISRAAKSPVKAYVFGDPKDQNRNRAFIDKLLLHRIEVYKLPKSIAKSGRNFNPEFAYVVSTQQPQYRMVQTMFETYKTYTDSVFY
ncbi:MAG: zinc carboxypeptidase, partial [Bacteroidetes bacterium]|nr:zinc carboxypeptidase [Bacteroidota bacterium]